MLKRVLTTFGKNQFLRSGKAIQDSEIIDYGKQLAQSQNALVLLPAASEEFDFAIRQYPALQASLINAKFTYVAYDTYAQSLPAPLRENTIHITEQDISAIGLLNKKFFSNIANGFDIVIDFNFGFDLCSTLITSKSQAKVKICFCHPEREPFYNLQIKTPEGKPLDQKIDVMLKYISILMQ